MTTINLGPGATYTLDTTKLDRILKDMPTKRDEIVAKAAFEIQDHAGKLAPVDTGALINSIFTKTFRSNAYKKSFADAQNRNPKVRPVPESEFGDVKQGEAIVGSSVEYAYWVEMGRKKGKVPARPFLGTAVEMQRDKFEKMLKELVL